MTLTFSAWVPPYSFALFSGDIAQLPAQLQPIIQSGYLDTTFQNYLEATNGYWESTDHAFESFRYEKGRGVTITDTRPGLKAPVVVQTDNAAAQTPFNNGVTASDFAVEQFTFTPFEIEDGMDLDLIGKSYSIVDRFEHMVASTLHQGYQSVDLIARDTFIASYATGSTVALANVASGTTLSVHVDDIRAFQNVITTGSSSTNGVVTPVSGGVPLPMYVYPAGLSTNQWAGNVTAAVPDVTNISNMVPSGLVTYGAPGTPLATRANGVSGTLTITTVGGAKTFTAGDVLIAGDAAAQIFSGGVVHYSKLGQSGTSVGLTASMINDAVNVLEQNGVPHARNYEGETEGKYLAHIAPSARRSLFNDPDFKTANQTLGQSEIYKSGINNQYLGVTFLPNTNAPRYSLAPYGGTGYAYLTIITGDGAIVDRWFEGLEDWAESEFNPGYTVLDRGIAFILMGAYGDRQGRRMHIDWLTIRDMVCPTDVTRSSVILTGNGARRARAVALWTWGAN